MTGTRVFGTSFGQVLEARLPRPAPMIDGSHVLPAYHAPGRPWQDGPRRQPRRAAGSSSRAERPAESSSRAGDVVTRLASGVPAARSRRSTPTARSGRGDTWASTLFGRDARAARPRQPPRSRPSVAEARAIWLASRGCDRRRRTSKVLCAAFERGAPGGARVRHDGVGVRGSPLAEVFGRLVAAATAAAARRCSLMRPRGAPVQTELAPVFAWAGARASSAGSSRVPRDRVAGGGAGRHDPERVVAMTPRIEGGLVVPPVAWPRPLRRGQGRGASSSRGARTRRLVGAFGAQRVRSPS